MVLRLAGNVLVARLYVGECGERFLEEGQSGAAYCEVAADRFVAQLAVEAERHPADAHIDVLSYGFHGGEHAQMCHQVSTWHSGLHPRLRRTRSRSSHFRPPLSLSLLHYPGQQWRYRPPSRSGRRST